MAAENSLANSPHVQEANRRAHVGICVVAIFIGVLLASVAQASITIPAGGSLSLTSGAMDMGCTDITVAGNMQVGSAPVTGVRNVTIQAGTSPDGTLDGGSGSITLAGNWSNSGTFIPGTSSVFFVDDSGCATSSTLSGNTTFNNLSLVSNIGKVYTISPDATQAVLQALTIRGTLSSPIQITSGNPGNPGYINLALAGTQNISHVGVSDNWATGQHLAPLLNNEGGTGNSHRWFGNQMNSNVPIPALGAGGIGLLALLLAGLGMLFESGRRRIHLRE